MARVYCHACVQVLILSLLLLFTDASAQRDEQLWLEVQTSYPFGNRYLLENTAAYQTLLKKDGKWRSLSICPTFEYNLTTRIDLLSEITLGYTNQTAESSSFEASPMVGARMHIAQNRRVSLRFLPRFQTRAFWKIEQQEWEISNRTRLRGEIYVTINGPNLFTDNLWYIFSDYEEFIVLDQQVNERYAYLRRGRIGLGYRLNYKHRFDLSYTRQTSRYEIDGDFVGSDNVIQFKYKLYFNPSAPPPGSDAD